MRKTTKRIAILGSGYGGVHAAKLLGKAAGKGKDISVLLVDKKPYHTLMTELHEVAGNRVESESVQIDLREIFSASGVEVVTEVKKESIVLKNGKEIPTRTLIWTCGVQGNDFAARTELTHGDRGRIQVNEYMQSVEYQNVFAVGDNAFYVESDGKDGNKPIPQIVEAALQTAETAVHNILAVIDKREKKTFKSNYHGFMVSIGGRYAVADIGGKSMSGFFAVALKHLVNIHYQYGVGGFARIWDYFMHEFMHVKEGRSILGGHLAAKAPTFWLAILRVYLGVIWLIEGVNKVKEGWLNPSNNFIVTMPKPADIPLESTDAVTNATQVTQYYPEPLLKQPPQIYQWFTKTFIEPNSYLFQVSVVLFEIAIGLALIAGLFTVLASLGSIFLCFNFILSAMAGTEILWHIFVAIAMFGGSGRAFGLDYYVIPWLKHWWRRTSLARRTHLYVR